VQVAAGSAGVPPQQKTQTFELGITRQRRLSKVTDFENVIVKTIPSTSELVYLKDVARVELGNLHSQVIHLLMENGRPVC